MISESLELYNEVLFYQTQPVLLTKRWHAYSIEVGTWLCLTVVSPAPGLVPYL